MKRPGFSISTILLVVILLGAVAWVGSLVKPITPQAHDHEAEQTAQSASNTQAPPEIGKAPEAKNSSEERKKLEQNELEQRRRMMKDIAAKAKTQAGGGATPSVTPMRDPEAIDPTADHFFKADMGAEGIHKQEAEISRLKKEFEAAKAKEKKSPFGTAVPLQDAGTVP